MKYIIMADGKGTRWNNHQNIPKHFVEVDGETILARVVRLLRTFDSAADVIITSHDPRYEIQGARRYEPQNNVLEIDRFTAELIENDVCFLYGDTYYSEEAMKKIVTYQNGDVTFFGNHRSIVAIKVTNAQTFTHHVSRVRQLFLEGKIPKCIGWQVYQSYFSLPFGDQKPLTDDFVLIDSNTKDVNSPLDL
jgi:choline kinase